MQQFPSVHISPRVLPKQYFTNSLPEFTFLNSQVFCISFRPRLEKSHFGWPRTCRFPTFWYWQVVNPCLLTLLRTHISVYRSQPIALIIGLISFLWNTLCYTSAVRGPPECDFCILARNAIQRLENLGRWIQGGYLRNTVWEEPMVKYGHLGIAAFLGRWGPPQYSMIVDKITGLFCRILSLL